MSVSEGLKKIVYKSFHVTLKKIDIYGNISNPPQSLSHKIKPAGRNTEEKNLKIIKIIVDKYMSRVYYNTCKR